MACTTAFARDEIPSLGPRKCMSLIWTTIRLIYLLRRGNHNSPCSWRNVSILPLPGECRSICKLPCQGVPAYLTPGDGREPWHFSPEVTTARPVQSPELPIGHRARAEG